MTRARRNQSVVSESREFRRWSEAEEQRLLRQIRYCPQNIKRSCTIVSEEIDRTPGAVMNHWYAVTSKRPEAVCFFTASERHVSKNRKNGMGVESNLSIWRRLMAVIRNL